MSWETNIPTFESENDKIKKQINEQLEALLESGAKLTDIVELLDAQDFFSYEKKGRGASVANFDVEGFVKKRISENRKVSLPTEYKKIDEVILPSSEKELQFGSGNGFKEKGIIPRSTLLMETLTEMGLEYSVIEGVNDPKMMRKLSYLVFDIPSIKKAVLVNDEEGNATFIIHKTEDGEENEYINKSKKELSEMSSDLVSVINYPDKNKEGHQKKWKEKIKSLLIEGDKEIPKDFVVLSLLMRELEISWPVLNKYVEEYEKTNPEWIKRKNGGTYVSLELIDMLKKKRIESKVPEGWLSPFALAKKLNIKVPSLQKQGEKYRQANPEWFKVYTNIQGKKIEHYSPELVDIISRKYVDLTLPPENWKTRNALSQQIGTNEVALKKLAEEYRETHPEYFKYYKAKIGMPAEYYSPELIKILIDKRGIRDNSSKKHYSHRLSEIQLNKQGKIELAPDSWLTVSTVKRLVNSGTLTVKEFTRKYEVDHPGWFGIYKNSNGIIGEYLHPELVGIIKKEFEKDKAMPGWLNNHMLSDAINVDIQTVKKCAEVYRISNPKWFKSYKDKKGIFREYYSPELVAIIKKELQELSKSFGEAPDGWQTKSSLRKVFKSEPETINKLLDFYRNSHPNWFKLYDERGVPREHYSPQLVKIIQETRKKETAPDGWIPISPLAKSINMDITTLQKYAEVYRSQHPEWFKNYRHNKVGRYIEFCSPELVEILRERFKSKN